MVWWPRRPCSWSTLTNPPTRELKMEAVHFFKTLVSTYKSPRRYRSQHRHLQRRKNLKSHTRFFAVICTKYPLNLLARLCFLKPRKHTASERRCCALYQRSANGGGLWYYNWQNQTSTPYSSNKYTSFQLQVIISDTDIESCNAALCSSCILSQSFSHELPLCVHCLLRCFVSVWNAGTLPETPVRHFILYLVCPACRQVPNTPNTLNIACAQHH